MDEFQTLMTMMQDEGNKQIAKAGASLILSNVRKAINTTWERFMEHLRQKGVEPEQIAEKMEEDDQFAQYIKKISIKISQEIIQEKLEIWAIVVQQLYFGTLSDFKFNNTEIFISFLEAATLNDLMVLGCFYEDDRKDKYGEPDSLTLEHFQDLVDRGMLTSDQAETSLQRISSAGLIGMKSSDSGSVSGADPGLRTIYYIKKPLGKEFLQFVGRELEVTKRP